MDPLVLSFILLVLSLILYAEELTEERPNALRAIIYVVAAIVCCISMTSVMQAAAG